MIAERRYHLLYKLQDSHFIISRLLVLFYDVLTQHVFFCTHLLCPFFFTVSVFCLTSVAASGGNSLLFY